MRSRSEIVTRSAVIVSFLQSNRGFWCNSCLEAAIPVLPPGRPVSALTRQLGRARRYYVQSDAVTCSGCSETKKCIRFVPSELNAA